MAPPKKPNFHPQVARVEKLAVVAKHNGSSEHIERVKKCFARAKHANANPTEAEAALKMAARIMEQQKIDMADLLADEAKVENICEPDDSTVKITQPYGKNKVKYEAFVDNLCATVNTLFDCRSCWTAGATSILHTFFGIPEQTAAAALTFEIMHFLILNHSAEVKGVTARDSFAKGASAGLYRLAREELAATKRAAEANERRSAMGTSAGYKKHADRTPSRDTKLEDEVEVWWSSSEENDEWAGEKNATEPINDVGDAILAGAQWQSAQCQSLAAAQWQSSQQLVRFKAAATEVQEKYLKDRDLKLGKGRKRNSEGKDKAAYRQGEAKSVDIMAQAKHKRIEDGEWCDSKRIRVH